MTLRPPNLLSPHGTSEVVAFLNCAMSNGTSISSVDRGSHVVFGYPNHRTKFINAVAFPRTNDRFDDKLFRSVRAVGSIVGSTGFGLFGDKNFD